MQTASAAGLAELLEPALAVRLDLDQPGRQDEARELLDTPEPDQEQRIVQILSNRKLHDAAFRRSIREAYNLTCPVTRLRIISAGGRPEVQAAHIWSVA